MALIGRLFAIAFGFLFASLAAGLVIVGTMLFPELSDIAGAPIDPDALNIVLGFGFIFVSGFALLPALIVVLVTEAFAIRSALVYAIGGAAVGVACYLGLVPFDPATLQFDGIVRRHLEIMTGAGIIGGLVYWLIAGRNAGLWRDPPRRSLPHPGVPPAPQPPSPPSQNPPSP
ncbi:hypothetical protein HUU61_01405 [Rhodopseudomonas palustris]|nr:hypothetical protein [Rhodopseudomonas palustris]